MTDKDEAAVFCAKYQPESNEVYQALVNASKQQIRELTRVLNDSSSSYSNRVKDMLLDIITRYRISEYIRTKTAQDLLYVPAEGGTGPVLVSGTK